MHAQEGEQESEGERAVDEEIAVSFDFAAVGWVEVDGVGVVGQGGEAEEELGVGDEGVGVGWIGGRCTSC